MDLAGKKYKVSFTWERARWGYKWENATPCSPWGEPFDSMEREERAKYEDGAPSMPSGPFLVEKHPGMTHNLPSSPLDNSLLFAQFADIAPTGESFLEWANEHGRLIDVDKSEEYTFSFLLSPFTPRDEEDLDTVRLCGKYRLTEREGLYYLIIKPDPLSLWRLEHRDLSFAVLLWELASNDDPRLLGILKWHEDTRRAYAYPFDRVRLDEIDFERLGKDEDYSPGFIFPPRRIEGYHPEKYDARKAALRYVQQEINRKFAAYPLRTRLEIDESERPQFVHEPGCLLSAMWYQLFLALMGEIRLKRCSICGRWEDMEGHRESWKKHANCANYDRVKRARNKKRCATAPDAD